MFGRDRFLLVIIMAGMAIAILLVDVLAMTSLVAPMVAAPVPTRSDAAHVTTDTKYLALLIPTYSPRITRPAPTPTPTATSWLPPAATITTQPERSPAPLRRALACQVPTEPVPDTGVPIPTAPPAQAVALEAAFLAPSPAPVGPGSAPLEASPSATPVPPPDMPAPVPTELATEASAPTSTPLPASTPILPDAPAPPRPPQPVQSGERDPFQGYVPDHHKSVGGHQLDVAAVSLVTAGAGIPGVKANLPGESAHAAFAAQTSDIEMDYRCRLLNDAKAHFGGRLAAINVVSQTATTNLDECSQSLLVLRWGYDKKAKA